MSPSQAEEAEAERGWRLPDITQREGKEQGHQTSNPQPLLLFLDHYRLGASTVLYQNWKATSAHFSDIITATLNKKYQHRRGGLATLLDMIIKRVQNDCCLLTCNFLVQIHKICNIYSIFLFFFFFCKCNALKHIIKHRSKNSLQVKVQSRQILPTSQLTDGVAYGIPIRQCSGLQISQEQTNIKLTFWYWYVESLRKPQMMSTFLEISSQYWILGWQESGILL